MTTEELEELSEKMGKENQELRKQIRKKRIENEVKSQGSYKYEKFEKVPSFVYRKLQEEIKEEIKELKDSQSSTNKKTSKHR